MLTEEEIMDGLDALKERWKVIAENKRHQLDEWIRERAAVLVLAKVTGFRYSDNGDYYTVKRNKGDMRLVRFIKGGEETMSNDWSVDAIDAFWTQRTHFLKCLFCDQGNNMLDRSLAHLCGFVSSKFMFNGSVECHGLEDDLGDRLS